MNKSLVVICLILFSAIHADAQSKKKPLMHSEEDVISAARNELDQSLLAPEGSLYVWATENSIQGKYYFDITVKNKGEVATVFCSDREGGSIDEQNKLKDAVKYFEFNFKLPKGKSYKFKYTFDFSN